jgi:urease accessory protein
VSGPDRDGRGGWHGRLELDYRRAGERTVGYDRHHGPLRVLKQLHPEGPSVCHHTLVHPPGGVVGGDTLEIDIGVREGAHALVTTPGATRFYRSRGPLARQRVEARLAPGARLEWLPLETIAYPGTNALNTMRFELAPGSAMIGWDLLSIGLPAARLRFDHGRFDQSIELPGHWLERAWIDAADDLGLALLQSPLGLDGRSAIATMWCASGTDCPDPVRDALLEDARGVLSDSAVARHAGATAPHSRLVVVRMLADRAEPLWQLLQSIRHRWRTRLWDLAADSPRVWST